MIKTCNLCGQAKAIEAFKRDKRYKEGILPRCRSCINIKRKEWRQKNFRKVRAQRIVDRERRQNVNPKEYWIARSLSRVRHKHDNFNLTKEYLMSLAVDVCPVF